MELPDQKRKAVLFGAFDRFNYGDLLYPLITRWMLEEARVDCAVNVCAQLASDLSGLGGEPTARLRDALPAQAPPGSATILVGGGEVLSQGWFGTMLASVNSREAEELLRIRDASGDAATEEHCRQRWSGGRRFPWLVSATEEHAARVVYHSVGGWPLGRAAADDRRATARLLAEATFVSVRDSRTWEILVQLAPGLHPRLAPDAVSLLARMWPGSSLSGLGLGPEELLHIGPRYICVQANSDYVRDNLSELAGQVNEAAREFAAGVVLLPFGHCRGWNDEEGLALLRDHLRVPSLLLPCSRGLRGMTAVLAGAALFVGTSLHGAIAASAYRVPAVPILTGDPKVGNYLATWPIAGDECVALTSLRDSAAVAVRAAGQRAVVQSMMETLVWENFQELLAAVQLKFDPSYTKMQA